MPREILKIPIITIPMKNLTAYTEFKFNINGSDFLVESIYSPKFNPKLFLLWAQEEDEWVISGNELRLKFKRVFLKPESLFGGKGYTLDVDMEVLVEYYAGL